MYAIEWYSLNNKNSNNSETYAHVPTTSLIKIKIILWKKNKMITIHFESGDGRMGEESIVEIVLRVWRICGITYVPLATSPARDTVSRGVE